MRILPSLVRSEKGEKSALRRIRSELSRSTAVSFLFSWQDTHFLDLSQVRDARGGQHARLPKDSKTRQALSAGGGDASGTLGERTLTVVYGTDFTSVHYLNFVAGSKETARFWLKHLRSMISNVLASNLSCKGQLCKIFTQIKLMRTKGVNGRVPVKR